MISRSSLLAQRVAMRDDHLEVISLAARRNGATALHVFGSLGRGTADALSDIDAWLTFPDAAIDAAVARRWGLYGEGGKILLVHEMVPNRPPGGAYALVLYATPAGPIQVDWYLAPQQVSRVDPSSRTVFADVAVPLGALPTDSTAEHRESLAERVSWLICMLFIALKVVARGGSQAFLRFLADAYRDVRDTYGLEGFAVTEPVSFPAVGTMLHQLARYADVEKLRALQAVDDFQRQLGRWGVGRF